MMKRKQGYWLSDAEWLAQSKPEYLSEFQAIAELTSLPSEALAAAAE